MTENKLYYTWQEFDKDIKTLAQSEWLKKQNIKNIYGIPRGGLIVAVRLSYIINKPVILNSHDIGKETLIVDDICDTGETLKKLFSLFDFNPPVFTIFYKTNPNFKPDFYFKEKTNWVVFPWEEESTSKYDGTFSAS